MPVYRDGRLEGDAVGSGILTFPSLVELAAYPSGLAATNRIAFVYTEESDYYYDATSVAPPLSPNVIKPDDLVLPDPGRWIAYGGGGGGPESFEEVKVNFTFATPSPLTITTLYAGQVISRSEIKIETAFDDPLATLEVGKDSDHDYIFSSAEIVPTEADLTGKDDNILEAVDTVFRLWLSAGSSTQGSGYVLLSIKRA